MSKIKRYESWPCKEGDARCVEKELRRFVQENLSPANLFKAVPTVVQPPPCTTTYNIGDTGPGGGMIYMTPQSTYQAIINGVATPISNPTDYYFEVALQDVSVNQSSIPNNALTTPCCNQSTAGCEFGNYQKAIAGPAGIFPLNIWLGTGSNNTDTLDSYSQGGSTAPPNPRCDIDQVAATACKSYVSNNGTNDWFLPSIEEIALFGIIVGPGSPFNSTLNIPTSGPEAIYWTSSSHNIPNNEAGFVVDMGTVISTGFPAPTFTRRCETYSVRPIRMFECTIADPYPPCFDHNNPLNANWTPASGMDWYGAPECIEYNYRDGLCGNAIAGFCSQSSNLLNPATPPYGSASPNCLGTTTSPYYDSSNPAPDPDFGTDSTMGCTFMRFLINEYDAMGESISPTMWSDDSLGYTITMFASDFMYLGKWKYDDFQQAWGGGGGGNMIVNTQNNTVIFKNPTHIDGNYPVCNYRGQTGSWSSMEYIYTKIEWAGKPSSNYATADQATVWGNVQFPTLGSFYWLPHICALFNYSPNGAHGCQPFYGVINPFPQYTIHPDRNTCWSQSSYCMQCCTSGNNSSKLSGAAFDVECDKLLKIDMDSNHPSRSLDPPPATLGGYDRLGTTTPSYIRAELKKDPGTDPGVGDYDPGDNILLLNDGVKKKVRLGCAQEYNNDPNDPNYGCLHIPYYPNLPPYDNPMYYSVLNDGCPNNAGWPIANNIDCCVCDIIPGFPKLGWNSGHQLAPDDRKKHRFGCAQFYQNDPSLPYYGWYAYNYNSANEGCDGGNGWPNPNNTDCCQWDIIPGGL